MLALLVIGPLMVTLVGFALMSRYNKRKLTIVFGLFVCGLLIWYVVAWIKAGNTEDDIDGLGLAVAVALQVLHVVLAAVGWALGRDWRRYALRRRENV